MEFAGIRFHRYGLPVLRIGMGLLFMWFGIAQLIDQGPFLRYVPSWTGFLGVGTAEFVFLNGLWELAWGACLVIGVYTRLSALILGLHIGVITLDVGYNAIGIRDFGLTVAMLAIFLLGTDQYCLDGLFSDRGHPPNTEAPHHRFYVRSLVLMLVMLASLVFSLFFINPFLAS